MSRLISATERITKARALIEKTRQLERARRKIPGRIFLILRRLKDLLRQGRELIKFHRLLPRESLPGNQGRSQEGFWRDPIRLSRNYCTGK